MLKFSTQSLCGAFIASLLVCTVAQADPSASIPVNGHVNQKRTLEASQTNPTVDNATLKASFNFTFVGNEAATLYMQAPRALTSISTKDEIKYVAQATPIHGNFKFHSTASGGAIQSTAYTSKGLLGEIAANKSDSLHFELTLHPKDFQKAAQGTYTASLTFTLITK